MKKKPCGCGNSNPKKIEKVEKKEIIREEKKFSETPLTSGNSIMRGISMVQSYAISLISRGISSKKVEPTTKKLRSLSCFGNQEHGGELPPCSHLMKSETEGKFYCGACGCGDKKSTWLNGKDAEYSKLDYPILTCPMTMPGFNNYSPSTPDEWKEPITRKKYIETMRMADVTKVDISINEMPLSVLEILQKMQQNSDEKNNGQSDA